jgi:hypothetical protein
MYQTHMCMGPHVPDDHMLMTMDLRSSGPTHPPGPVRSVVYYQR